MLLITVRDVRYRKGSLLHTSPVMTSVLGGFSKVVHGFKRSNVFLSIQFLNRLIYTRGEMVLKILCPFCMWDVVPLSPLSW